MYHRLIKIINRTLDVLFSRFLCVSFTIILRQKPKGVKCSRRRTDSFSVFVHRPTPFPHFSSTLYPLFLPFFFLTFPVTPFPLHPSTSTLPLPPFPLLPLLPSFPLKASKKSFKYFQVGLKRQAPEKFNIDSTSRNLLRIGLGLSFRK